MSYFDKDFQHALAVLAFAEQLLLAQLVEADGGLDAGQQAALEGGQRARDAVHLGFVQQLQRAAALPDGVQPDEAAFAPPRAPSAGRAGEGRSCARVSGRGTP